MKDPTKTTSNLSLLLFSFILITAKAFQPTLQTAVMTRTKSSRLHSAVDVDFYNPSRSIDMEHAHDCAEHFGKCSIEELENMRAALHTERLQHQAANYQSSDITEEIDHRLLEEDLSFQLELLKNEMHTLPRWSSPHFIINGKPSFSPPPVMMDTSGNAAATSSLQQEHQNHTMDMKSMIRTGEQMFLVPNGLADIVSFGVALLIISMAPFLFVH